MRCSAVFPPRSRREISTSLREHRASRDARSPKPEGWRPKGDGWPLLLRRLHHGRVVGVLRPIGVGPVVVEAGARIDPAMLGHERDAAFDRAHLDTEVAADAFRIVDHELALTV